MVQGSRGWKSPPCGTNEIVGEVAWLVRSDAIVRNVPLGLELAADLPSVSGDWLEVQHLGPGIEAKALDHMFEPRGWPTKWT